MSKLALSDIQDKFTDYRVLAASEDGLHIALLDNKGCACAYTFASKEDTAAVIPERIVKVGAKVPITFEDGTEIAVDASEFPSPCVEELATVKTSLCAVTSELESAKAEVAAMKEFEAKRRVQAAKDAAARALEAACGDVRAVLADLDLDYDIGVVNVDLYARISRKYRAADFAREVHRVEREGLV